jgi:hypothetical protein
VLLSNATQQPDPLFRNRTSGLEETDNPITAAATRAISDWVCMGTPPKCTGFWIWKDCSAKNLYDEIERLGTSRSNRQKLYQVTAAIGAVVAEGIHPRLKSDIIANTNAALKTIKRGTTSEVKCVKENLLDIICFNNLKKKGVETVEDMTNLVAKVLESMTLSKYLLVDKIIKKAASSYLQLYNVITETGADLLGSSGNSIKFTKFITFC